MEQITYDETNKILYFEKIELVTTKLLCVDKII
jgi:hypothetical protein